MNSALCFNDCLPYDNRPEPVVKRNGSYYLRLFEKDAKSVQIRYNEELFDLENVGDDIWEMKLFFKRAVNYVQVLVDGREVLEAILPITFGYSRPYNYIELPEKGGEFYELRNVEHGSVRREYFFSETTGRFESCLVYTPAVYDREPCKVFPVLYLQHGHGENETDWTYAGKVNFIMDNLLADKKAKPFVIVMNNGMVQNKDRVVDHLLFEPMLLRDIIPFIENKYHVGGSREKRGMAGLSMGSMQTSMTVMNNPDMFSEVGIFSGFLRDWISGSELDMKGHEESKNKHLKALDDADRFNGYFKTFFRGIGDEDPFMEHFLGDDEILREKGISCTRKIYSGSHDWNVWRSCFYDFAQLIFRQ